MPVNAQATKTTDVVIPQVLSDMVSGQLSKALKFLPIFDIDTTLTTTPGNTITVAKWSHIGAASDVVEGQAIPIAKMSKSTIPVTVKKAGIGVEITDEAKLSGYGDPIGEATKQIKNSIADKIDNDCLACLKTATQTATNLTKGFTVEQLETALGVFESENENSTYVAFCNPKDAQFLRMDASKNWMQGSALGADAVVSGALGKVSGVDIVPTKKLNTNEAILVRFSNESPTVKLILKKNVEVESDRDIINKSTVITADQHYACYLYNEKNVVKINFTKV